MSDKYPNVWRLASLLRHTSEVSVCIDGGYAPARPHGFPSVVSRIRCAWLVFTGRADAVIWPEDEWKSAGSGANVAFRRAIATQRAEGE